MHEVVVVGGGIAGAECALALHDLAPEHVSLALVTPTLHHPIEALAPATAFGLAEPASIPVADLCAYTGARMLVASVSAIQPQAKTLALGSGESIGYDIAVLAMGARRLPDERADITYLGTASAADLDVLIGELRRGEVGSVAVVLPAGSTWTLPAYELALLLADVNPEASVRLLTPEPAPLAAFGPRGTAAIMARLAERGVQVHEHPAAGDVAADRTIAMPRTVGPALHGLLSDEAGFVLVDEVQRVLSSEYLYAIGDCTAFPIKQGSLAAAQADVAAAHIAGVLGARVAAERLVPVMRGKLIAGKTPLFLRNPSFREHSGGEASEDELWRPATKIWGHYLPRWLTFAGIEI